ncbi:MAG: beta-ketoacyl synthase N-terminal-like domain-containing protein [Chloroflexota bacterium]
MRDAGAGLQRLEPGAAGPGGRGGQHQRGWPGAGRIRWHRGAPRRARGSSARSPSRHSGSMAACQLSMEYGLTGPVITQVAACASSVIAFLDGLRMIRRGDVDVVLTGGSRAPLLPVAFAALANMGALSKRNDDPQHASRPFDANRIGFLFGEVPGWSCSNPAEHALARGAAIHAEVIGGALTADAFHISAPRPTGRGAARAMTEALRDAGVAPDEVDYIVAHGTSTPLNDVTETRAIKRTFGDHAYRAAISSPKSMVGHLLGAAGMMSALAAIGAIRDGMVPPTINLGNPDLPECDLDYVPNVAPASRRHHGHQRLRIRRPERRGGVPPLQARPRLLHARGEVGAGVRAGPSSGPSGEAAGAGWPPHRGCRCRPSIGLAGRASMAAGASVGPEPSPGGDRDGTAAANAGARSGGRGRSAAGRISTAHACRVHHVHPPPPPPGPRVGRIDIRCITKVHLDASLRLAGRDRSPHRGPGRGQHRLCDRRRLHGPGWHGRHARGVGLPVLGLPVLRAVRAAVPVPADRPWWLVAPDGRPGPADPRPTAWGGPGWHGPGAVGAGTGRSRRQVFEEWHREAHASPSTEAVTDADAS